MLFLIVFRDWHSVWVQFERTGIHCTSETLRSRQRDGVKHQSIFSCITSTKVKRRATSRSRLYSRLLQSRNPSILAKESMFVMTSNLMLRIRVITSFIQIFEYLRIWLTIAFMKWMLTSIKIKIKNSLIYKTYSYKVLYY